MPSEVRNRRTGNIGDTVRSGMARLESAMGDSVLKFRLMPSRAKLLLLLSGILSLLLYLYLAKWLLGGDADSDLERLLNSEKCPACYGGSACGLFYHNQIELTGMSRFRTLDMINDKNVHFGITKHDRKEVVLKKLATDTELAEWDRKLCLEAKRPEDCDIARVIVRTERALPLYHGQITPEFLKGTGAFMFQCPSYRLIDRMWTYFREYKKKNEIFAADKMQILYTSLINPEPLIFQTFPKSEGWPFPEYFGSCGRVAVVESGGQPLSNFVDSSFQIRANIAYELMQIAEKLTTNPDYALYLTDVNYDNFAVSPSGKVTVVDAENIIVVDKVAVGARKQPGWNEPLEAMFSDCDGKNCLIFSKDDICKHLVSDHNYNAICRNILSRYAVEAGMPEGFLHDMPVEAEDYWDLGNLLEECARPKQTQGRWKAKDKIMEALKALRDDSKEHLKVLEPEERKGRMRDQR